MDEPAAKGDEGKTHNDSLNPEEPPPPQEPPVSDAKNTAANKNNSSDKTDPPARFWSNPNHWIAIASVVMAVGTVVYTCVARSQLIVMNGQLAQMERDSRPWIKIVEATLNAPETLKFDIHQAILFPGETLAVDQANHPNSISPIVLRVVIKLKNIGKSAAQEISVFPELFVIPPNTNTSHAVDVEQRRFCQEIARKKPPIELTRSALFPDDDYTVTASATGWVHKGDVQRIAGADSVYPVLIACVVYQMPLNFQTSAVYYVAGHDAAMIKYGEPLEREQMRLIRDDHAEHAQ
jgi:hypothetical protein